MDNNPGARFVYFYKTESYARKTRKKNVYLNLK